MNTDLMKITILMIDDHKLLLEAWTALLTQDGRFSVIGAVSDTAVAIELVKREHPRVVITDINMSPVDGFEFTRQICMLDEAPFVMVVTFFSEPAYMKKMLKAGALGYVTKNSSKEELIEALLEVSAGRKYICREIRDKLSDRFMGIVVPDSLRERELEIMRGVKEGLSSKEIADRLGIARKTVEVHRYNILKKLELPNAAALINYMNQRGI